MPILCLKKWSLLKKEIAKIVAINDIGEIALYPAVHMVFDQRFNLLDFQWSLAEIPERIEWKN